MVVSGGWLPWLQRTITLILLVTMSLNMSPVDCFRRGGNNALGEACADTTDCLGPNAMCEGSSNTCVCNTRYYDNNGRSNPGGECTPKLDLGQTCQRPDACLDNNAVCRFGKCACPFRYYQDGQSCRSKVGLDRACSQADACATRNAECRDATCQCVSGFTMEGQSCARDTAGVPLGGNCANTNECDGPNAICNATSNTCVCRTNFYDNNGDATPGGQCTAKVALGIACPQVDACRATNSVCNSNVCECDTDYYADGTLCRPRKALGFQCDCGLQCADVGSECDSITNRCVCKPAFYDDNGSTAGGSCTAKVSLGRACPQSDACAAPNSECQSGTCGCSSGYYVNGRVCTLLGSVGESCSATGDCKGSNVECSGSPSTCRCPSDRYLDETTGNCLTKLVLGDACALGQCGTANSYCDSSSSTCACEEGYYDDNGATSGGTCTAKVALNAACTQTDACSDVNAECSSTCVCVTGYYNNGGTCEPLLCFGEVCSATSDCKGSNVECSGSPSTCRCPSDRYLDETSGDCLTKLVLGDACELGQCGTTNSFCDSSTSTCLCEESYYDDNGATSGGTCTAKDALGAACSQADACSDVNAECSSTCVCVTGYYNNAGTCEPLLCIGESCSATSDCKGSNVECSGSPSTCRCPSDRYLDETTGDCLTKLDLGDSCELGQCGTANSFCESSSSTCACEEGYYDDNGATSGGACTAKVALGTACTQTDACSDVNAECSSTCVCVTGYYNNGGTCEPLLCIGESCSATGDCKGSNVECSGSPSTCRCPSDRYLDETTGDCLTKLDLGDACALGQCGTANSFCESSTSTCACEDSYYDDNGAISGGSCTEKVALDAACSQIDACLDVNAECFSTCVCITGYYNNGGICEPLLCVGENCTATSDCKGSNVECSGSPATCRCPSDRYLDETTGDCVTKLDLGDSCELGQCGTANSFCESSSSTCACEEGYYDDNGATSGGACAAKLTLGAACTQTDACSDVNAECSSTCVCVTGYYNNAGTCEPLLYIGDSCVSTGDCKGSNVECSGSPSTCRCPSDRYLDETSGDCLTKLVLGDACELGQCGTANSFCESSTNTCVCEDSYYDDNGATSGGTCAAKIALDAACSQTDACSDVNAECSTVCVCVSGYYNNAGTCEPLLCIGETCAASSDCKGSNVECSGSPLVCRCPSDRYLDETTGNCLTKLVLGDACELGQCGTANSYCESSSSTCVCEEGYYDDNGATSGGACNAKLALDIACSQTDACSDVNAECSTTCVCVSGYYNNAGTCDPLLCIGETCAASSDCKGSNVECSGSPLACRCPSDRYLDETTGNCLTKLVLGDACELGQCGTANSYCESSSSTCVCEEGYYDDNGVTSGGACNTKLALDVACSQTDACSDVNAECSTTCVCVSGYYNNAGTCDPLLCIGETCAASSDCKGSNVECSGSPLACRCPSDRYLDETTGNCLTKLVLGDACELGQCGTANSYCESSTSTCACEEGYYDDNGATSGGACATTLALNAACTQTDACSDVNAECSSTCVCVTGYYNNGGTCEPLLSVGESCSATGDCKGSNVECSGSPSTCRCPSDRYLDETTGDCLTKLVLGDACALGQCGTANSYCESSSSTCACEEGYYDDNGATSGGACTATLALDVSCSQTDACTDVNAECSTMCVCVTGFYNNGGTCEPLLCIGESCSATSDCKGSNVECSGSPSTCRCPSDRYLDETTGNCLTKVAVGAACTEGQCVSNSYCSTSTSVCECVPEAKSDGSNCLICPGTDWEVYDGSCYYFGNDTDDARYDDARVFCDTFDSATTGNSNLVQVDTTGELTFIKDFITNRVYQPSRGYWNDLYEETTNGNEVWRTTGDPLTVPDWAAGQPRDDNNQIQKCTIFVKNFDYKQGDFLCDSGRAIPLCETTPP